MKHSIGFVSGLALAAIGASAGVYLAWRGFASTPYNGEQLGMFFGLMGALVGCTCAFIGAFAGHRLKRSASITPPRNT